MSTVKCGIAGSSVEFPKVVPCTAPENRGHNCLMAEVNGFNLNGGRGGHLAYHEYRYVTNSGHPYYVTGIGEWAVSFEYPIGTLHTASGFRTRDEAKDCVKREVMK